MAPPAKQPAFNSFRGKLGLLLALFGGPCVWLLQMWICEPLAAQACYPHTHPAPEPVFPYLARIIDSIGILAVLLSALVVLHAHRRWTKSRSRPVAGERTFLNEIALMSAAACLVAVLFNGIAVLIVDACRPW
jgi:hypothetical protein